MRSELSFPARAVLCEYIGNIRSKYIGKTANENGLTSC